MSFLQWKRPECTIQSQFTHSRQKRFGRYYVDGYCDHCRTVFEAMGCFHHFCECQDQKSCLLEDIEAGLKRRQRTIERREYFQKLGVNLEEIWECKWWLKVRSNSDNAKDFMNEFFPFSRPMSETTLLTKIRNGSVFGVVDCELEVPSHLYNKFKKFPPIFKNVEVSRNDIGLHMQEFAIENKLLSQPRRMLISSMKLDKGPIITPLLQFYIEQGVEVKKIFAFIEYKPQTCFRFFI